MKSLIAVIFGLFVFAANAQSVEKHHPVKPGQHQPHYNHNYQNNHNRHYNNHNYDRHRNHNHHYHNHYYYQPVRPVQPTYNYRYVQPYDYYYAPQPIIIERGSRDWVAPLIGGVILGAVITEANRNYYYGY